MRSTRWLVAGGDSFRHAAIDDTDTAPEVGEQVQGDHLRHGQSRLVHDGEGVVRRAAVDVAHHLFDQASQRGRLRSAGRLRT